MTTKPKTYAVQPAKGQALLAFQGRRFADKVELYETDVIEEVRQAKKSKQDDFFTKQITDLNPDLKNLLIHGDCLSACAYLKSKNIKPDLVYIDPPFASGANYAKQIYLRNGAETNFENDGTTIGEEVMYGDIWQKEDYLNWLYERLLAIRDVMSETGSIYLHLDWHIGHYAKIMLDEIFGEEYLINEIIWHYRRWAAGDKQFQKMHDVILYYSKSKPPVFNPIYVDATDGQKNKHEKGWDRNSVFINGSRKPQLLIYDKQKVDVAVKSGAIDLNEFARVVEVNTSKTIAPDVWQIDFINSQAKERLDYSTQKPEALLERIINASSNENMIVADFFSGSGTTAKVAHTLDRKFIACDVGINAIQTSRDRLSEAGAEFNILKIKDGLRLFRNPAQTTTKIFSLIDGFKPSAELELSEFWQGGIARPDGAYSPVKFIGIHEKLTEELLDVIVQEIISLEDTGDKAKEILIVYAHKDRDITQAAVDKEIGKKSELKIKLLSLDELLQDKKAVLYLPDNADIAVKKDGNGYKVEIKKFFSPYLKNKIDDYNAKKVSKVLEGEAKTISKPVELSKTGLELIESVQFDTTLKSEIWTSNPDLEDKAMVKEKIKAIYHLPTDKFRIKIRNIAGDEMIIDSAGLRG